MNLLLNKGRVGVESALDSGWMRLMEIKKARLLCESQNFSIDTGWCVSCCWSG